MPIFVQTYTSLIEALTTSQWLIMVLCAMCIGMSKTGIQGIMLPIVPLMALTFGAKESTGVILPMLCMADIIAVAYYKRNADWKLVARLLPTAVLGFFIAVGVDRLVPAGQFKRLMGATLALALVVMFWTEFAGKENRWMNKWWYSALFGLLGGFTTMIGNAASPVMAVYLLSMRKDKMSYVGINAWFFLIVNLLKVPIQIFAWHNISWEGFKLDLMMLPAILVGAVIGISIVKVLPEKIFRRFIQVVTVLAVIAMFL